MANNIVIENARIGFRNFSGKEGKFNPPGKRNFCWFIDDFDLAERLKSDGWNVKELRPREEGDKPQPYLQVAVNYDNRPPKIVLVTSSGKNVVNEEEVGMLDWAEISNVDLIVTPYNWEFNGRSGIKAYVKSMYITIEEDEFEKKYADNPNDVIDEDIPF